MASDKNNVAGVQTKAWKKVVSNCVWDCGNTLYTSFTSVLWF